MTSTCSASSAASTIGWYAGFVGDSTMRVCRQPPSSDVAFSEEYRFTVKEPPVSGSPDPGTAPARPCLAASRLGAEHDVVAIADRGFHRVPDGAADEHALVQLSDAVGLDPALRLDGLRVAEVSGCRFERARGLRLQAA